MRDYVGFLVGLARCMRVEFAGLYIFSYRVVITFLLCVSIYFAKFAKLVRSMPSVVNILLVFQSLMFCIASDVFFVIYAFETVFINVTVAPAVCTETLL